MAPRIVPEAGVTPTASPVSRFVSPRFEFAEPENGWMQAAEALQTLQPSLQRFLGNRFDDMAATSEAEGQLAEVGIGADVAFGQGREAWSTMISNVRRTNPELAERLTGANPHFRRGLIRARMNRLGMALNDHLQQLWQSNEGGVQGMSDPAAVSQWAAQQSQAYAAQYGIGQMDPVLLAEIFLPRVNAAQQSIANYHARQMSARATRSYNAELSANAHMILAGGAPTDSPPADFLSRFNTANGPALTFNRGTPVDPDAPPPAEFPLGVPVTEAGVAAGPMTQAELRDIDADIEQSGLLGSGLTRDGLRAAYAVGGREEAFQWATNGAPEDSPIAQAYGQGNSTARMLQAQLDQAIADGMNPRTANQQIVQAVLNTANESLNVDVLDILDEIRTPFGPLSNIGELREDIIREREDIENRTWNLENREYTREERTREAERVELETSATREIIADPFMDISAIQDQAIAMGQPGLAVQLGTFQQQLIDREFNVRDNHEIVANLRYEMSRPDADPDRLREEIRRQAGIHFSGDTATRLFDDLDRIDQNQDLMADRQVNSTITDFGQVVGARFASSNSFGDPVPAQERAVDAEGALRRDIWDFITENPEATPADVRRYAEERMTNLLRGEVWQPTDADQFGDVSRNFGDSAALSRVEQDSSRIAGQLEDPDFRNGVFVLMANPQEVISIWQEQGAIVGDRAAMINAAAATMGITAQEFFERYAPANEETDSE